MALFPRTLLIENVSQCLTCVASDIDTCDYFELYHLLKILSLLMYLC